MLDPKGEVVPGSFRKDKFHRDTILDGEIVNDVLADGTEQLKFLVFDALIVDNKNLILCHCHVNAWECLLKTCYTFCSACHLSPGVSFTEALAFLAGERLRLRRRRPHLPLPLHHQMILLLHHRLNRQGQERCQSPSRA